VAATVESAVGREEAVASAAHQLRIAGGTRKCSACRCLRHALDTIERTMPRASRPDELTVSIAEARSRLVPQRYECLVARCAIQRLR